MHGRRGAISEFKYKCSFKMRSFNGVDWLATVEPNICCDMQHASTVTAACTATATKACLLRASLMPALAHQLQHTALHITVFMRTPSSGRSSSP